MGHANLRRRRRLVSILAVCAAVAFSMTRGSAARADVWPSYQHDAQHTGLAGVGPVPSSLTKAWSAPTGFSSPLIVGDTVYGLQNGQGTNTPTHVAAFDLATGQQKWNVAATYVFPSQEAYAGGNVVFVGAATAGSTAFLHVLDAATGAEKYTVPVTEGFSANLTTSTDPTTGQPVAYVADGNHVSAVQLGASSGTVAWTAAGGFGSSIPTVLGNQVLLASPDQYYAINRTTGAVNHFHNGGGSGGGGTSPVADATRNQFYVTTAFNGTVTNALTAYGLSSNGTVTQLWQDTGTGIGSGGSVALGPDGKLYINDNSNLVEIDPTNGHVLRTLTGASFANGSSPIVSAGGYVWDFGPGNAVSGLGNDTVAYRLSDFTLAGSFPGTRGNSNSQYTSAGALDDTHLIIDYGNIYNSPGFDVYTGAAAPVPEPAGLAVIFGATALFTRRRHRRACAQA